MSKMFDYDGDYPITGQDTRYKNMAMIGEKGVRGSITKNGSSSTYTIKSGTVIFLNGFTIVFEEDEQFDLTGKPCLWAQVYPVENEDGTYYAHKIYAHENDSAYSPGNDHYMFYSTGDGFIKYLYTSEELKKEIKDQSGSYTLPVASESKLGGVKPVTKTAAMTQSVGVDSEGRLYTKEQQSGSYTLPIASESKLGGVKPVTKTAAMTQSVGVDNEGRLYTDSVIVTPKMFGAVGDGVTDDTEAVQAAIDSGSIVISDKNAIYAISENLSCGSGAVIHGLSIKAIAGMDTCITYSARRTIIENVSVDCNNLASNGIAGSSVTPSDTDYVAEIRHCTVVNADGNGFDTGAVRSSFRDCIAKYCDIGFLFSTTDTTSDQLVPIDCNIGVELNSSTTILSMHPWSWTKKQTAIHVPSRVSNIKIGTFFNDTNNIGILIEGNCNITINDVCLYNNKNTDKAIDANSRFIKSLSNLNTRISINNIQGSFEGCDKYMEYPDIDFDSININNIVMYNMPQFGKILKNTKLKSAFYSDFLAQFTISSPLENVTGVSVEVSNLTSNLEGYQCDLFIKLTHDTAFNISEGDTVFTMVYNKSDTSLVNVEIPSILCSFSSFDSRPAFAYLDGKSVGFSIRSNTAISNITGTFALRLHVAFKIYR